MDQIIVKKEAGRTPFGAYQIKRFVEVDGRRYLVSFIKFAPDTAKPECMAFRADARWDVRDFGDCARSFDPDPRKAVREVLRSLTAAC